MKKIRKCAVCGNYTLEERHCGSATLSAHPAPFNPNDPHGHYRRLWKGGNYERINDN